MGKSGEERISRRQSNRDDWALRLPRKGGIASWRGLFAVVPILTVGIIGGAVLAFSAAFTAKSSSTLMILSSSSPQSITTTTRTNADATLSTTSPLPKQHHRQLLSSTTDHYHRSKPLKILYTITTLAEYDEGSRNTKRGFDRLQNLLIPVLVEGVESLLAANYQVDVVIVAHYTMTRSHLIRQALPESVGLRIWDDAAPLSYPPDKRDKPNIKLKSNTLALARQHRFVVKDNLFNYDFFLCFEDDMIITADHVQNHLEMTQHLYELRDQAPDEFDPSTAKNFYETTDGNTRLTKSQLKRMFPGLIRVEVLLEEDRYGTQRQLDPVPLTHASDVNVQPCCHLQPKTTSPTRPAAPTSDKVFLWETGIRALGVRELPNPLGWVVFQRGPRTREEEKHLAIGDYWSGREKYFGKDRRPQAGDFAHVNNQGGWMATRQQIWEWHTEICLGGFLPPYEAPHFNFDGLDMRNVEYWSGGLHLVTARHACNLQRIVSLEPERFARQLIYHSANNKQRQLQHKKQSFVKIDNFYQQLLTVKKNAESAKQRESGN